MQVKLFGILSFFASASLVAASATCESGKHTHSHEHHTSTHGHHGSKEGQPGSGTTGSPPTTVTTTEQPQATVPAKPAGEGEAQIATTTRYYDSQKGACGCGTGNSPFDWQNGFQAGDEFVYTAAGSQVLFGDKMSTWCGKGCGKCYKLTSTGKAPSNQGSGAPAGTSITVMVTNLCPNNGNAQWCPNPGSKNQYDAAAHFDIMMQDLNNPHVTVNGQSVPWNNPIVTYEETTCPGAALTNVKQCECQVQGLIKTNR